MRGDYGGILQPAKLILKLDRGLQYGFGFAAQYIAKELQAVAEALDLDAERVKDFRRGWYGEDWLIQPHLHRQHRSAAREPHQRAAGTVRIGQVELDLDLLM